AAWYETRRCDRLKRCITFEYDAPSGDLPRLARVQYNNVEVRFTYEDRRDRLSLATLIGLRSVSTRLAVVLVTVGGRAASAYRLEYHPQAAEDSPSTLKRVVRTGTDASVDPATNNVTGTPFPASTLDVEGSGLGSYGEPSEVVVRREQPQRLD